MPKSGECSGGGFGFPNHPQIDFLYWLDFFYIYYKKHILYLKKLKLIAKQKSWPKQLKYLGPRLLVLMRE